MSKNDEFGKRIKSYEKKDAFSKDPIVIRVDGKNFSNLTKRLKLKTPYDYRLNRCFKEASHQVMKTINAYLCYFQSDEITFVLKNETSESEHYLGGKRDKLNSVVASLFTFYFNKEFDNQFNISSHEFGMPIVFDCRSFQPDSDVEVVNSVLWRVHDCSRNVVFGIACEHFPKSKLFKKSSLDMLAMISEVNDSLSNYPTEYTYGTLLKRQNRSKTLEDIKNPSIKYIIPLERVVKINIFDKISFNFLYQLYSEIDYFGNYDPIV